MGAARLGAMTERTGKRGDFILVASAVALGVTGAVGFAAWRAISREGLSAGARFSEFGQALFFPGTLILVAVGAMVWLGWKANID